jgi:hypothetical protein
VNLAGNSAASFALSFRSLWVFDFGDLRSVALVLEGTSEPIILHHENDQLNRLSSGLPIRALASVEKFSIDSQWAECSSLTSRCTVSADFFVMFSLNFQLRVCPRSALYRVGSAHMAVRSPKGMFPRDARF